jgi:hypothetical protein
MALWLLVLACPGNARRIHSRPNTQIAVAGTFGYFVAMIRSVPFVVALLLFAIVFRAGAETNAPATSPPPTNRVPTLELREQLRARCLDGRRSICGKILRVFPNGLLVESGYTNLLREPLTKSWLVPGTVVASRAENLVESKEPGALCVGTVFVTDLPRGKPQQFDYVILAGYPTGEFTYNSVGSVRKTVRRFSTNLDKAVQANLAARQENH